MSKSQYRVVNPLSQDAFKNVVINLSRPEYDQYTERIDNYRRSKQYDKEATLRAERDTWWKSIKEYANSLVMTNENYEIYLESIKNDEDFEI